MWIIPPRLPSNASPIPKQIQNLPMILKIRLTHDDWISGRSLGHHWKETTEEIQELLIQPVIHISPLIRFNYFIVHLAHIVMPDASGQFLA
jgi:hypothetical protein